LIVRLGPAKIEGTDRWGRPLWRGRPFDKEAVFSISAPYGEERSYGKHTGVDIACPVGTPIYALAPGRVAIADPVSDNANGMWVRVEHIPMHIDHYDVDGHSSNYLHLSEVYVKQGQYVGAGTMLGLSGNTGNSTGPHLHLSVHDPEAGPWFTDPVNVVEWWEGSVIEPSVPVKTPAMTRIQASMLASKVWSGIGTRVDIDSELTQPTSSGTWGVWTVRIRL
jgi:murein DD-endopeptidase MepM/ murein hydrolase activator NlpD